jgi:xanthine phosphoribosyltransferase
MKKIIIDHAKFQSLISNICRQISVSEWRPDYVAGITRGGLLPAVMISHYLGVPMKSLDVSLRDSTHGPVSDLGMAEDAYDGKKILIVDDINDTGATLNWIMKDWPAGCFPMNCDRWEKVWNENVRFATVVDNLASDCEVGVYYAGMEVNKAEDDVWIEYPWEDWWTK